MFLHHNPLVCFREEQDALQFCSQIARGTVEAIVLHMNTFRTYSQLGQWACAVLVQCIYHLVPSIAAAGTSQADRGASLYALQTVKALLLYMSTHQGSAKRAQRALKRIFSAAERIGANDQNTYSLLKTASNVEVPQAQTQAQTAYGTSAMDLPLPIPLDQSYLQFPGPAMVFDSAMLLDSSFMGESLPMDFLSSWTPFFMNDEETSPIRDPFFLNT